MNTLLVKEATTTGQENIHTFLIKFNAESYVRFVTRVLGL